MTKTIRLGRIEGQSHIWVDSNEDEDIDAIEWLMFFPNIKGNTTIAGYEDYIKIADVDLTGKNKSSYGTGSKATYSGKGVMEQIKVLMCNDGTNPRAIVMLLDHCLRGTKQEVGQDAVIVSVVNEDNQWIAPFKLRLSGAVVTGVSIRRDGVELRIDYTQIEMTGQDILGRPTTGMQSPSVVTGYNRATAEMA